MGTDIHLFVEKRTDSSSPWQSADSGWEFDDGYPYIPYQKSFYHTRNYSLFAILANVRNGYGFAGVATGSGFIPISQPRGWPEDVSPEVRKVSIDHTPSWLLLSEIMAYDWTQETTRTGIATVGEWAWWKTYGKPNSWCDDIVGPKIKIMEIEKFEEIVETIPVQSMKDWLYSSKPEEQLMSRFPSGTELYVRLRWKTKYYEEAREFLSETIPRLWRLGDPSNVRILFFFDS